jgi:hypothetical protein
VSEAPTDLAALAADLAALRQTIADLAVIQAEGLNAMVAFALRSDAEAAGVGSFHYADQTRPPTARELRARVLAAAERSLAIASALVDRSDS